MSERITVAVVALGGYGSGYVKALLEPVFQDLTRLVGAVDPNPALCPDLARLEATGVPVYAGLQEFYDHTEAAPDLVVISSPIHLHAPQTILALSHGGNVLCEKPMCATIQEADAIIEARDRAGKFVAIGYQRSYSPTVQALKHDILAGHFGRPKRLKSLNIGSRSEKYYGRNNWAGALKSPDGAWVLDSPANNANAHFLHHMFYILGERKDRSARPVRVVAELYRANDITNCDTVAIRACTEGGAEILFYASHAVDVWEGPSLHHTFEKGQVTLVPEGDAVLGHFGDGTTRIYGGFRYVVQRKLREAIQRVSDGGALTCPPEAARSQTLCINAAQDSMPGTVEFPKSMIELKGDPGDRVTYVPGLADALRECYEKGKLPSELGFDWARPGKEIDLTEYRFFPGGAK